MLEVGGREIEKLRRLFHPETPNHPMLFATFSRGLPCRAVADRGADPSRCVVRTNYGPTFASPGCDPGFASRAVEIFREEAPVFLVREGRGGIRGLSAPDKVMERVAFDQLDPGAGGIPSLVEATPRDCDVREMTAEILDRCAWRDEVVLACGTAEAFLGQGLGLCLMRGEEILCEAYALFWGEGVVEIGAVTAKDFRGRSLAPITCAHLIRACGDRGYRTYWSCHETNSASQAVARKLGYERRQEYTWLHYRRSRRGDDAADADGSVLE